MIIGCDESRVEKLIGKEVNKERLKECLNNEKIKEAIRQNDMQLLSEELRGNYSIRELLKIVPVLLSLLMLVGDKVNANKLLEYSTNYLWDVPMYYMNIDVIQVKIDEIPKLTGCTVSKILITSGSIDSNLSNILKLLNLKKCKTDELVIEYTENKKEYIDMNEDKIREYIKSVGGEINILEWIR